MVCVIVDGNSGRADGGGGKGGINRRRGREDYRPGRWVANKEEDMSLVVFESDHSMYSILKSLQSTINPLPLSLLFRLEYSIYYLCAPTLMSIRMSVIHLLLQNHHGFG